MLPAIGIYSILCLAGIFYLVAAQMTNTLHLCCKNDSLLVKLSNSSEQYKCLPSRTPWPNSSVITVISNTHNNIYGYGISSLRQPIHESNIPNCEHHTLKKLKENTYLQISSRSCLIGLEDSLAVISCPLRSIDHVKQLNVMKKCCPPSYIYDGESNRCIERTKELSTYDQLPPGPIVFKQTNFALSCPDNTAVVEYEVNNNWISLENGHLHLAQWQGRQLPYYYDYCIEAIYLTHQSGEEYARSTNSSLLRICTDGHICQHLPCIRLCCKHDEMFVKDNATSTCRNVESHSLFSRFSAMEMEANFSKPTVFGLLHGIDCRKYRLDPASFDDELHSISDEDGSLRIWATNRNHSNQHYCIAKLSGRPEFTTFVCFDDRIVVNDRWRFRIYGIGLLISCSFYAITLLMYLTLPKLRNLPGKILICLISSLLVAYLGIALAQLMPTADDDVCFASGFFIYFCLMAAFAWMNVTCFDIWQTFGRTSQRKQVLPSKQDKRFLLYSAYGWGLPCLITCITVGLAKSDLLPENMRPNFGKGRCWFTYNSSGLADMLFFYGPVGILFLINFVLFVLTLRYCNRVKREIYRMQSLNIEKPGFKKTFFMHKARFAMNTKLFVAMGITWLLELLSIMLYKHQLNFVWFISDSFNVLLGISVFFIFVFKKRNWQLIRERFGMSDSAGFKTTTATSAASSVYTQSNLHLNTVEAYQGSITLLSDK